MSTMQHDSPANRTVVLAENLRRVYPISTGLLRKPDLLQAVGGVSFAVQTGKTLARRG